MRNAKYKEIMDQIHSKPFILASKSPRRAELLERIGFSFEVVPSHFDESEITGLVESIKSVSDLNSPITGIVTEKNTTAEDTPEALNEDAFSAWLIKIKISDPAELDNLMDSKAYAEYCEASS